MLVNGVSVQIQKGEVLAVGPGKQMDNGRRAEPEVKVGDLQSFPVLLQSTKRIKGNPAVDAFLLERLQDGGKFYAIVSGTTDGATDIVLDILLHASMGYDTGLF